jgi:cytochrome c553
MPKHIKRLLILVAVLAAAGLTAKQLLVPKSFYLYGHYRGDAITEIASKVPKLQGSASCRKCHAEEYAQWSGGIHQRATRDNAVRGLVVKFGPGCEVCHNGPAGNHPSREPMPLSVEDQVRTITHKYELHPADIPGKNLMMPAREMQSLCLNCHDKLEARPKEQPQIAVESHNGTELCTTCHSPHSPRVDFAAIPLPAYDPATGKPVAAPAVFKPGNAAAGRATAAMCAGCHGANGVSPAPAWPNLAGQHDKYLVNTLQAFKNGARKNDTMSGVAAGLSDDDINNVAAFFSKAACKTAGGDASKVELGKARVLEGGCNACHSLGGLKRAGAAGISAAPVWPNLAGQNADYLAASLKAFKDGSRNHAVMSSIAQTLSDADIDNVAAYFSNSACNASK